MIVIKEMVRMPTDKYRLGKILFEMHCLLYLDYF